MVDIKRNIEDEENARIDRELETRDHSERPKTWAPAAILPDPIKQAGYVYRWVRVSSFNQPDPRNLSAQLREGWEPVRAEEQPHFKLFLDPDSRFKDNIEISGLLLCKCPAELMEQRKAHFQRATRDQMTSVDNNFMRENDSRMPLFTEKRSQVSFGKGK